MKSAIPWVLVVVLLGGIYFLYSEGRKKDVQITRLGQDSEQLAPLRSENEELLKKLPAQNEELARLRKEHEEVLRLRNDVQRMRDQNKQLTTQLAAAQAQTAQARQAQQQASQQAADIRTQAEQQSAQVSAQTKVAQIQANICIGYLRQIDGAKQSWALENKKNADAVPTPEELSPFLQNAAQIICPAGGVYTINAVGVPPACTIPGHSLAQAK